MKGNKEGGEEKKERKGEKTGKGEKEREKKKKRETEKKKERETAGLEPATFHSVLPMATT